MDKLLQLLLTIVVTVPTTVAAMATYRRNTRRKVDKVEQTQAILLETVKELKAEVKDLQIFADGCVSDRRDFVISDAKKEVKILKLEANYEALEAQLKNVKEFERLDPADKVVVDGKQ